MTAHPLPTAAILIIGNEILSGKTQDVNTSFIAARLNARGIRLCEARVVRDEEGEIVDAARALSARYTHVFTTGGIGPTHDDITAASIAAAFGAPLEMNEDARAGLAAYYDERGEELNAGRLRMAMVPRGAGLIPNPVSGAPGFIIGNVHVMAGIPKIMQAMFLGIEHTLAKGPALKTRSVTAALRESEIAAELGEIQKHFPDVEIGSYPQENRTIVITLSGTDEERIASATEQAAALARRHGKEPAIG